MKRSSTLLLILFALALLPVSLARADLTTYVSALEIGTGTLLAESSQSSVFAPVSSAINYPSASNLITYGALSQAANSQSVGLKTMRFKMYTEATRFPNDGVQVGTETLSQVGWTDAVTGTVSPLFLNFKIQGQISLLDSVNTDAFWEFQANHENGVDPLGMAYVSATEMDGTDTVFEDISGWQSFTHSEESFTGVYRAKIYSNSPFNFSFTSIGRAAGGGAFLGDVASVNADLTQTITLEQIMDSNGNLLSSVAFDSGGQFSAVPEPGSLLFLALVCTMGAARRRHRP